LEGNSHPSFRAVSSSHPGFADALEGTAAPRGGSSTPQQHNEGITTSEFTSWTTDIFTAKQFAGEDGVVLMKDVPESQLVDSPDFFGEQEILVRGSVNGAKVLRKN
jgi:hypothetical protein